jgi:hypothetical protein
MATTLGWRKPMRSVRLWDATWMVLEHPTGLAPIVEMMRSEGYQYPAGYRVTCGNGHTWENTRDRRGLPSLPDGVQQRYRVEYADPDDPGETIGYDPYWVCSLCEAEVPVRWLHTGPIVFPVEVGEELLPNNTIRLGLIDTPDGFTVHTVLTGAYPLLDADGNTICEIAPQELGVSDAWDRGDIDLSDPPRLEQRTRYALEAAIISPPREALAALLQAVYVDTP